MEIHNMRRMKNPNGSGYVVTYRCPSTGCGADGSAIGDVESGPFYGGCSRGHAVTIPWVKPGAKS